MVPAIASTVHISVGEHFATGRLFGLTVYWSTVYSTLIAGGIVIGLGLLVRRSATKGVPGRLQLAFETIVRAIQNQVEASIGPRGAQAVPLAFTLFVFILLCNWIGLLPTGTGPERLPAPTSDVNLTYALALLVIVMVTISGIRARGARGYVAKFFKPYKGLFLVNGVEEVAKPVTLALRLFGNIFSGAIMVALIASLITIYLSWAPTIIWKLFDMFIGVIQAFIFALLTILYFEFAMTESH